MELDTFLREALRRWYIPLVLAALAAGGLWLYLRFTAERTAEAVVQVPVASIAAFDSVMNGQPLAERVATRLNDGTTAGDVRHHLSGGFKSDTGRLTPQYGIQATDRDGERAKVITNIALGEGLKLFSDTTKLRTAFQQTALDQNMADARGRLNTARTALNDFLAENNAYGLPTRIAQQAALVAELRDRTGLSSGIRGGPAPVENRTQQDARSELQRLLSLQPGYERLQLSRDLAQGDVERLESQATALSAAGQGFEQAKAAIDQQAADARIQFLAAQQALSDFATANNLTDLPNAIRDQQAFIDGMILEQASATSSGDAAGRILENAETSLARLQSLQPEYDRLDHEVKLAQSILAAREQQEIVQIQRSFTPDARLEVVSTAEVKSRFWWTVIRYSVAELLALFLAVTAIYILALIALAPATIEQLESIFGAPVIAHVPRARPREVKT